MMRQTYLPKATNLSSIGTCFRFTGIAGEPQNAGIYNLEQEFDSFLQ